MAIEKDLDLLDDYIANKLTGGEKEAFEKRLEHDPELKREFQLQQELVEGIKKTRVAELKQMLNNTPVPAVPPGQGLVTKITIWTMLAGLVVTGLYFLFHKQAEQVANTPKAVTENKAVIKEEPKVVTPEAAPSKDEKPVATEPAETHVVQKTEKQHQSPVKKNAETVTQRPNVFDPTADQDDQESNIMPDQPKVETPVESEKPTVKASTLQVVTDDTNKKYTFHYQIKDGKVYLYGSFEKNVYEILEFFSGNKRTAFLYYKDNYYLLSEENEKIKPLVPINDPVLRSKLKEYRSK